MWVMTKNGFISAVEHRENHNLVLIRSRTEECLRYLCEVEKIPFSRIEKTENADYMYRLVTTKEVLAQFLAFEVLCNLNYGNFKSHCKEYGSPTKYLSFLNNVWTEGLDMQDGGFYNTFKFTKEDWYDEKELDIYESTWYSEYNEDDKFFRSSE